jgi:hypothetical protein
MCEGYLSRKRLGIGDCVRPVGALAFSFSVLSAPRQRLYPSPTKGKCATRMCWLQGYLSQSWPYYVRIQPLCSESPLFCRALFEAQKKLLYIEQQVQSFSNLAEDQASICLANNVLLMPDFTSCELRNGLRSSPEKHSPHERSVRRSEFVNPATVFWECYSENSSESQIGR